MAIPQQKPVAARPKQRRHKRRRMSGRTSTSAGSPTGRATGASRATSSATTTNRSEGTSAAPGPKPRGARPPQRPPPPRRPPTRGRPAPTRAPSATRRRCACCSAPASGPCPARPTSWPRSGSLGAVQSLTRPSGAAVLHGPAPVDDDGNPLAPADAWGHDHLWWLDRMVRSDQPLVERMALVLHDWFATSNANVSKTQQMIDQSNLFRARCFGSFLDLFKAVTVDPAMLQWLNGNENYKWAPNENYGREMMELFSLGADRGAYTRGRHPRTGARADRLAQRLVRRSKAPTTSASTRNGTTPATRRSSARPATGAGKTPAGSASSTRSTPPSSSTSSGATSSRRRPRRRCGKGSIATYVSSGWQIRPVLEAILTQPRALRRAADGEAAGRPAARRCCGRSAATSTPRPGSGSANRPGSGSSGRRTSPAGTTAAGSTPRGCGRAGTSSTTPSRRSRSTPGTTTTAPPRPPTKRWRGRSPPGARRNCAPSTAKSCSTSPAAARNSIVANWQKGPYRALRQNALLQLIGVSPDVILQ